MRFTEVLPMSEYEKALEFNRCIREALITVFNELNRGQQQKLMKNDKVRELFERYGVSDADC